MNKLYRGSRYLITLKDEFVAPDNYEYKAVFGQSHDDIDLDDVQKNITFIQIGDMTFPIRDIKSVIRTNALAKSERLKTLQLIYKA